MSRSYRHTPILKSGRDQSNREFKVEAHQKFRRETKKAIHQAEDEIVVPDPLENPPVTDAVFPLRMRDVSEIWCSKQEYKYKMFGDYWAEEAADIAQQMVVRPYYTKKDAEQDLKRAKRGYRRLFCK